MNDQKLARVYLDFYDGGISLLKIIKNLWGIRLIFRLLGIIIPGLAYFKTNNTFFLIFTCIVLGATLEAFLYYYKTLKLWPFTKRIVDWKKVKIIAYKKKSHNHKNSIERE